MTPAAIGNRRRTDVPPPSAPPPLLPSRRPRDPGGEVWPVSTLLPSVLHKPTDLDSGPRIPIWSSQLVGVLVWLPVPPGAGGAVVS